jgi:arginyl-tRNA synthetase
MEFDLDLASRKSQENPVYYVQYAHARLCSILRQAAEKGIKRELFESIDSSLLQEPEELNLLKSMSTFPAMIENAALELAPHKVTFYLIELASQFHSYYNKHKVLTNNIPLGQARLCLIEALRVVVQNGLDIIGLSAPEKM